MGIQKRFVFVLLLCLVESRVTVAEEQRQSVELHPPVTRGDVSVEQAISQRRSLRRYDGRLTLGEVSQLLWAAQGKTDPDGYRAAPSAGALYPLEVYLLAGDVTGLPVGFYRYRPEEHDLVRKTTTDLRKELAAAARGQSFLQSAAAVLVG